MTTAACLFLLDDRAFARLVDGFITSRPQVRAAKSKQSNRLAPWAFRAWLIAKAWPINRDGGEGRCEPLLKGAHLVPC